MSEATEIELRPERPADREGVDEVVRAAFLAEFGSTSEVDLVRTMRVRGELVGDLTLVAVAAEEVVGFIALSEVTVDGERVGGLGLAPVAVLPSEQGAGVGSHLIVDALDRARRAGWTFVVLLGHETYYPRFGFRPAARQGLTGDYGAADSWMAISLVDGLVPSGHVRYCSAFDA